VESAWDAAAELALVESAELFPPSSWAERAAEWDRASAVELARVVVLVTDSSFPPSAASDWDSAVESASDAEAELASVESAELFPPSSWEERAAEWGRASAVELVRVVVLVADSSFPPSTASDWDSAVESAWDAAAE
jgi:hypothetical protein